MSNQVNVSVDVKGKDTTPQRFLRPLTLDKVCEWIRRQEFDEYTTNGLIEIASKYPTNALWQFRKHFNLMVGRVRAQRRRELGGVESHDEETIEEVYGKTETEQKVSESSDSKQRQVEVEEDFGDGIVEEV